jgi:hypothetical protein
MSIWTFAGALLIVAAVFIVASGFLRTWLRYRGERLITCPETAEPAAVKVDSLHAAQFNAVTGENDLRLRACSRWPERSGCGQECLAQIEQSPEGCLVKTIVTRWYDDRACAFCGQTIGPIAWHERPPGVVTSDHATLLWKDVSAEQLPKLFASSEPVCWRCHVVESFRREHPEMVIERRPLEEPRPAMPPSATTY